ncbi:MAG: hypothetical protein JWR36_2938 [Glaciihabitans sp.]|nr:hypothetical protein [Glaciihabitans sp.]
MWGIYGATGYTGRLIAAEALARGHRPVLLGRSAGSLRQIADATGLEFRLVADAASADFASTLGDLDLLVNAAGPFDQTVGPTLGACIASTTAYLDISNELATVLDVLDADGRCREAGTSATPGVGYGTVASEAVAARAHAACPDAVSIEVALLADNAGGGAGTAASVFAVLADGGVRLVDGEIVRSRLGRGIRRVRLPIGRRSLVAVATGDLAAVQRTTGVRNVTASVAIAAPATLLAAVLPAVSATARTGWLKGSAKRTPRLREYRSYAWARATNGEGGSTSAWLATGEGYAFTASSVVSAVEATLAAPRVGAFSSGAAFGPDFALRVPGTTIDLLDDVGARVAPT